MFQDLNIKLRELSLNLLKLINLVETFFGRLEVLNSHQLLAVNSTLDKIMQTEV